MQTANTTDFTTALFRTRERGRGVRGAPALCSRKGVFRYG